MKSKIFLTLLYSLITFSYVESQTIDWVYIPDRQSLHSNITITANNDILQSRFDDLQSIARIDQQGNLLWEETIWYEEREFGVVISAERADKSLIHVTRRGDIYTTDSNGSNSQFISSILHDSIEVGFIGFIQKAKVIKDKIHIIGGKRIQGITNAVRASINPENLEIKVSIIPDAVPLYFDFKSDKRVELLINSNNDEYKILLTDEEENLLLEKKIVHDGIYQSDIVLDKDENIILVGNSWSNHTAQGFITSYASDGSINWTKKFPDSNSSDPLRFETIATYKDGFLVGGAIYNEYGYFSDAYIMFMTKEGEVLWDFTEHIHGEGDVIEEIVVKSDSEILVAGTAGLTDYGGPQRAYIMRLNSMVSNISMVEMENAQIFPNPGSDYIQITGLEEAINQVMIYDVEGKNIYQQCGTQPIDVTLLNSGVYFVKVVTEQFSFSKKWVKN